MDLYRPVGLGRSDHFRCPAKTSQCFQQLMALLVTIHQNPGYHTEVCVSSHVVQKTGSGCHCCLFLVACCLLLLLLLLLVILLFFLLLFVVCCRYCCCCLLFLLFVSCCLLLLVVNAVAVVVVAACCCLMLVSCCSLLLVCSISFINSIKTFGFQMSIKHI